MTPTNFILVVRFSSCHCLVLGNDRKAPLTLDELRLILTQPTHTIRQMKMDGDTLPEKWTFTLKDADRKEPASKGATAFVLLDRVSHDAAKAYVWALAKDDVGGL